MKEFLKNKGAGFYVSLSFIAVIAVVGVGMFIWNLIGPKPAQNVAEEAPTSSSESQTPSQTQNSAPISDDSICGLKPNSQEIPTKWDSDGTVWRETSRGSASLLVPQSDKYGGKYKVTPQGHDAGMFRGCYSHDPMGAVFAAMNEFSATQTEAIYMLFQYNIENDGIIPDPDKGSVSSTIGKSLKYVGFKVDAYTPDKATVDILFNWGSEAGNSAHFKASYVWKGGDWKLLMHNSEPVGAELKDVNYHEANTTGAGFIKIPNLDTPKK
jgi:hypothetical protein